MNKITRTVIRDLEFKRIGIKSLKLDVHLPNAVREPVPFVVWVCGGAWQGMDKEVGADKAPWLTNVGLAVASIEYRVSNEAIFPAQIQDCKAALRWLRAHADELHLDAERVGVWGESAGGHLVELLGSTTGVTAFENDGICPDQPTDVCAVCAFYGPSDLTTMPVAAEPVLTKLLGVSPQERPDVAVGASPHHYVGPHSAPHLLVHGDADPVVPVAQSIRMAKALRQHRVPTELRILPGAIHGGTGFWDSEATRNAVAAFFLRWLKP